MLICMVQNLKLILLTRNRTPRPQIINCASVSNELQTSMMKVQTKEILLDVAIENQFDTDLPNVYDKNESSESSSSEEGEHIVKENQIRTILIAHTRKNTLEDLQIAFFNGDVKIIDAAPVSASNLAASLISIVAQNNNGSDYLLNALLKRDRVLIGKDAVSHGALKQKTDV